MIGSTAVAAVVILGGSFVVELPADRAVAALEIKVDAHRAAGLESWQEQKRHDRGKELQGLRWQIEDITRTINDMHMIPQMYGRPISPEEQGRLDRLRDELERLLEREQQILSGAG